MKTSELLQEARDILALPGTWCMNHFVEAEGAEVKAHCAVGGLMAVAFNSHVRTSHMFGDLTPSQYFEYTTVRPELSNQYIEAIDYLAAVMEDMAREQDMLENFDTYTRDHPMDFVTEFNDSQELGSQESVLRAYDRAIANAKAVESVTV